jgi:hypothetical protein
MNQKGIRNTYALQCDKAAVSVSQHTLLLPSIGETLATQSLLPSKTALHPDPVGKSVLVHGNQTHDAWIYQ